MDGVVQTNKQKNLYVNLIKYIACLGVIQMHSCGNATGLVGIITAISTISVPIFFMLSGYYSGNKVGINIEKEQIRKYRIKKEKKVIHLLLWGLFLSAVFELLNWVLFKQNVVNVSLKSIIDCFLFNNCQFFRFSGPFWFLCALTYVYFILERPFFFRLKFHQLVWISMILFVFCFLLEYCLLKSYISHNFYYRNFFLEGIPCFCLGRCIYLSNLKKSEKNTWLYLVGVLGLAEIVFSKVAFGYFIDMFIGTPLIAMLMILWATNCKRVINNKFLTLLLSNDVTMYIYIIHMFCIMLMQRVSIRFGVDTMFLSIETFILALILASLYNESKKALVNWLDMVKISNRGYL